MSDEQIEELISYVRAAIRSAVAEAKDRDEWTHDRLDAIEEDMRRALADPLP